MFDKTPQLIKLIKDGLSCKSAAQMRDRVDTKFISKSTKLCFVMCTNLSVFFNVFLICSGASYYYGYLLQYTCIA